MINPHTRSNGIEPAHEGRIYTVDIDHTMSEGLNLEQEIQELSGNIALPVAHTLRIMSVLQATIDLEQVLKSFSQEVSLYVPHESLDYENTLIGAQLSFGRKAPFAYRYRLNVTGKHIGSVVITCRQALAEHEVSEFEYLLCSLIYPLSNALQYRKALESAHHDPLTKIMNRSAMEIYITREINIARRHKTPLSVLLIDLDNFKTINDRFGHAMGDTVIRQVADRYVAAIRNSDLLFRYGGDEFTVLLSNTGDVQAAVVVDRVLRATADPIRLPDGTHHPITASIGVASLGAEDDYFGLVSRADQAMYLAKTAGGNRCRTAAVPDSASCVG